MTWNWQSAAKRMETQNTNPNRSTLKNYAHACGYKLEFSAREMDSSRSAS
ncbi:MAG: hypothetical protein KBF68_08465 [Nitrosomonas sp.]|jgi:hypothetical protein|nr:hypothetical protein [Nitrosomonas sp.]MBP9101387.1 hypothetical protein [Nitrosomonas sp.]